mgnify:CR=1 FL=1
MHRLIYSAYTGGYIRMRNMKKEISIDQFARMVQKGFTETISKMDMLATKEGLERLEGEIVQIREEIFK